MTADSQYDIEEALTYCYVPGIIQVTPLRLKSAAKCYTVIRYNGTKVGCFFIFAVKLKCIQYGIFYIWFSIARVTCLPLSFRCFQKKSCKRNWTYSIYCMLKLCTVALKLLVAPCFYRFLGNCFRGRSHEMFVRRLVLRLFRKNSFFFLEIFQGNK